MPFRAKSDVLEKLFTTFCFRGSVDNFSKKNKDNNKIMTPQLPLRHDEHCKKQLLVPQTVNLNRFNK
jgi:hypothetical protein